jgi:hypothetical protein
LRLGDEVGGDGLDRLFRAPFVIRSEGWPRRKDLAFLYLSMGGHDFAFYKSRENPIKSAKCPTE